MTLNPRDENDLAADDRSHQEQRDDVDASGQGEQLALIRESHHIGPLPPADEFVAYNRGTKDAADRILKMAEQSLELRIAQAYHQMEMERQQAEHQQELDRRDATRMDFIREDAVEEARGDRRSLTRSQYLAAGIVVLFVGLAALAVVLGQAWVGAAFGGIAMAGIVTAFLNPGLFGRSDDRDNDGHSAPPSMDPADREQIEGPDR